MAAQTVRERLIHKLFEMTDQQVASVLSYADAIDENELADYDATNDPAIGFMSGSTDLAGRSKAILRDEIITRSGWTQKKD
ncbi:MAG: hypothetical protein LCI00_33640 [Chloroflexi bacterium]|nr:hypothetical protein [Chloroflexota bacterium]MCC6894033.1 hypothetical protein [Anaerolineae bacterium]